MRNCLTFILLLIFSVSAKALKITSVTDGNWEDSSVWSNGIPPGYTCHDTIEITHCVLFNEDIHVEEPGMFVIADSGKICGKHNIYCAANTEMDILGTVYFDTIFSQGYLYLHSVFPSVGHLIRLSAPGHAYSDGWSLIYFEFECSCGPDSFPPPPAADTIITEEFQDTVQIDVGPIPFSDWIHVKVRGVIDDAYLTDDIGRLILKRKFESDEIQLGFLAPGIYFLNFIVADGRTFTKKIVKLE